MRIILLILIVVSNVAHSQTNQPNKPIELPEFIVTGTSRVDVPGGAKADPAAPPKLQASILDSLNPIEKLALPALPSGDLPSYSREFPYWPGYVRASMGNYLTPAAEAGYSFNAGNYLLDVVASIEASDGWVPNSDYVTMAAGLHSTYIAPEQFLFFGGSTTTASVFGSQRNYAFYASSSAPRRSVGSISADVNTNGQHEALTYHGSVGFTGTSIGDVEGTTANNSLSGKILLQQKFSDFTGGIGADVYLRGYAGNSYPFTQAYITAANTATADGSLRFNISAGPQFATTTTATSRFGIRVAADAQLFLSPNATVVAKLQSGLRNIDAADLLAENPFMDFRSTIDVPYELFDVSAAVMLHPVERFTLTAGLHLNKTDRDQVWVPSGAQTFLPGYASTTTIAAFGDVRWVASASDVVHADIRFTNATVDGIATTPYVPAVRALVGHMRSWTSNLESEVSVVYVGNRFADLVNKETLSGFIDVQALARYSITHNLSIEVQARNLFGSTMVIWQGYRERDIFVNGGILWKF